ncbi:MAG: mechanosensitive ion channel family protein [Thermoflexus sp.]
MMKDLTAIPSEILQAALRAFIILALTGLLWWGIGRLVHVPLPKVDPERARRIEAALSLIRSLLRAVLLAVALLMLLSLLGLNLAPVLTGAGIAGIIIGLGAQSLVRDLIAGLIIVLEDPFGIGETVRAAGVVGTVERITMRATYLRDADGTLHVIPNSMLGVISNLSRDWAQVAVEFPLPRDFRLEHLELLVRSAAEALARDPEVAEALLQPPAFVGIEGISEATLTVRIEARARPKARWTVARRMRYHLVQALQTLRSQTEGEIIASQEG